MTPSKYTILLFYKYTEIANPEGLMREMRQKCLDLGLMGRIILAREGINATVEGLTNDVKTFQTYISEIPGCNNVHFKLSDGIGGAFPRLSIKVRDEIVSGSFGELDVNPNQLTGKYIYAEELHDLIHNSDEEFYIVDMRNDYEHAVGHFKNSLLPALQNFRDLLEILPELEHLKDKKVVTVCTGGIRCEKASGLLVSQGFNNVYQLFGGIVTYMEKYPNQDFLGKLYVFDKRVVMGFNTDSPEHVVVGICDKCGTSCDQYVNCALDTCHRHFICCENCTKKDGFQNQVFCDSHCVEQYKNEQSVRVPV